MSNLSEAFKGLSAYLKGHRVIIEHRLWKYMTVPGFISIIYISLLILLGRIYFPGISQHIFDHWLPEFLKFSFMITTLSIMLWVLMFLLAVITYQAVVLILFSPVLGYISEVTENAVYHRAGPDFKFSQLIKDLIRGIIINVRNLSVSLVLCLACLGFILIPLIGAIISSILIFSIQSYYNGFGLTDYTLERKKYSVKESYRFNRENRARTFGVGAGFMLLLMIPVIGWFFAPAYGAVSATLSALDIMDTNPGNKP